MKKQIFFFFFLLITATAFTQARTKVSFNSNWKFFLGDDSLASKIFYDDSKWRTLNLPHDWSIEGNFSEQHATTYNQGALPAGTGWYRKTFTLPSTAKGKQVYISFDGVYRNSEVWINGHTLGKRPYGYSSFQYDLTPFLRFGKEKNSIAVRVDNSAQPSSRWYTGSGIYRNVWLEMTNPVAVAHWGSFISTPEVSETKALITVQTKITNASGQPIWIHPVVEIYDAANRMVASGSSSKKILINTDTTENSMSVPLNHPKLWSVDRPYLYKAVTKLLSNGKEIDRVETTFGIRSFSFDAANGFFLNSKSLKILGVCLHHDLGALGAAVNKRAIERQLEILKQMGANA
ncbi:MAG TPA: beta galactosidase jelly roll domain-containing protein, partial [Flavisolibacter sp.]|nr:beta galactosidase jelly roll domain-containing protein [Flavisolibacter sp.]